MAIRKLQEWCDLHFNEELVSHFIHSVGIFPLGTLVRLESGLLGIVIEHHAANLLFPTLRVVYNTNKRWKVEPYDVDFSKQSTDRVVGYESPEKWGIKLSDFLPFIHAI